MWCDKCHFGGEAFRVAVGSKCPMCKGTVSLTRNPFSPKKPQSFTPKRQDEDIDEGPKVEKIVKIDKEARPPKEKHNA